MTIKDPELAPAIPEAAAQGEKIQEHVVRKIKAKTLAASVLGRALHPRHLWTAAGLHRHRKANRRAFDDTRLALYAQILPSDFLHYGFFDDVDRRPEQISLEALTQAQARYAELLLELVGQPNGPILDVGCGMGGLTRMIQERGMTPVALTPDRMQAAYVARSIPGVTVLRCKLEALSPTDHAAEYGAVVTAESLQYLKLDKALPIIRDILQPGAPWVACDYFLTRPSSDHTCHNWDFFNKQITEAGWRISYQRDITANVLPTLAFLHMLAARFGLPLMDFVTLRLRRKQPGLHHLLAGLFGHLEGVAADNVGLINPAQFARDRQYMMLKLERN